MTRLYRGSFLFLAMCLAACQPASGDEGGATPTPDAPAETVAEAGAPPRLKPGLWRTTSITDGEADEEETVCVRPDQTLSDLQLANTPGCSNSGFSRAGGSYRLEAVCQEPTTGARLVVSSTFGGDLQTTFSSDMKLTAEMPGAPPTVTEVQVRGRRIGDCAG